MSPEFRGRHARWRKTYNDQKYVVYCSELGLPEELWTELGSYQAANEWWLKKKAEIDAGVRPVPPEVERVIKTLRTKKAVLTAEGKDAHFAESQIADAYAEPEHAESMPDPHTAKILGRLDELGIETGELYTLPKPELDYALGATDYWDEKQVPKSLAQAERTVGYHLDRWAELMRQRVTPTTFSVVQSYLKIFRDIRHGDRLVLGGEMQIDVLTEAKLDEAYLAFKSWDKEETTKQKQFVYFRSFVRHLIERRFIPPLANIDSKAFTFKVKKTGKEPADARRIRDFLGQLPDRFQLYALLALNCSMNNIDIAQLTHGQIDWSWSTLTRKRVKTEGHENVPVVRYKLWPETVRLLKQEMTAGGKDQLVLSDAAGAPLYIAQVKDGGKVHHYDKIKSSWRDYFGRSEKKEFTLRDFRYFGADLLEETRYETYQDAFLGHSPNSVKSIFYKRKLIDVSAACEYIRKKLFGAMKRKPSASDPRAS
jgi:hypothetical protein